MFILVTGGTGFVGTHAVAALRAAGHQVRLFVRSPERVAAHLSPLGVGGITDVVAGDVTDRAAVERALAGCDAVVHAASTYTFDVRRAREMQHTNVEGTRAVLETAWRLGLDPIVHVSSTLALVPANEAVLTPNSPPGKGCGPYSRSKAEAERIVRSLQNAGAPVVSVMPVSLWGPDDPYGGAGCLPCPSGRCYRPAMCAMWRV